MKRRILCLWQNDFIIKNFSDTFNKKGLILRSTPPCIYNYNICMQDLRLKYNYIIGDICWHRQTYFWAKSFNLSIRFIWLNVMYIIPDFCCTNSSWDRAIGPTLPYHKWAHIWCFIFLCNVFCENDNISDFIVVVDSMSLFLDVIYINLRLLLLTY